MLGCQHNLADIPGPNDKAQRTERRERASLRPRLYTLALLACPRVTPFGCPAEMNRRKCAHVGHMQTRRTTVRPAMGNKEHATDDSCYYELHTSCTQSCRANRVQRARTRKPALRPGRTRRRTRTDEDNDQPVSHISVGLTMKTISHASARDKAHAHKSVAWLNARDHCHQRIATPGLCKQQ